MLIVIPAWLLLQDGAMLSLARTAPDMLVLQVVFQGILAGLIGLWVYGYAVTHAGAVQAAAPRILRAAQRPEAELIRAARNWAGLLFVIPTALTLAALISPQPAPWLTVTLVAGLMAFGAVFAVNSSLHSYLILAFTRDDRVTMDVGFYYMANAGGRLIGTVLSGLTYQLGGLALTLGTAAAMVALSAMAAGRLRPDIEGPEYA